MSAATLEIPRVAEDLYGLHIDLDRFTSVPVVEGDLLHYADVVDAAPPATNIDLYNLIHNALMGANHIISKPNGVENLSDIPKYPLTVHALRAAQNPATPNPHKHYQDLCLAAELKVLHSIERNRSSADADNSPPAAVVFDVDGQPFAYSKSEGLPVALAWREAAIATAQGEKVIPVGSFFKLGYGEDGSQDLSTALGDTKHGLVSLERFRMPNDVRLYRFSAFLLQGKLAECAYLNATDTPGYRYLAKHVLDALELGLAGVSEQVHTLLRQGEVHRPVS